ncbi:MAG: DUF262 domain-containing protein [Candidatus Pacearchaeota archaeon]|jgi:hypothetical protein|nr:DUF262 domain-containing protein [Clostridia bacterium]
MKPLDLFDVRKKLPFEIHKGMATESISFLAENHYGDVYDTDVFLPSIGKNLQRDHVWTLSQQQEFIISVLKGIKIANISWIQYRDRTKDGSACTFKIIDGKQRFTAITKFYNNEFPIEVNDNIYFFKDLADNAKYEIAGFNFTVDVVYEYSNRMIADADKIAWFEQINFSGTPQDAQHLENLKK